MTRRNNDSIADYVATISIVVVYVLLCAAGWFIGLTLAREWDNDSPRPTRMTTTIVVKDCKVTYR